MSFSLRLHPDPPLLPCPTAPDVGLFSGVETEKPARTSLRGQAYRMIRASLEKAACGTSSDSPAVERVVNEVLHSRSGLPKVVVLDSIAPAAVEQSLESKVPLVVRLGSIPDAFGATHAILKRLVEWMTAEAIQNAEELSEGVAHSAKEKEPKSRPSRRAKTAASARALQELALERSARRTVREALSVVTAEAISPLDQLRSFHRNFLPDSPLVVIVEDCGDGNGVREWLEGLEGEGWVRVVVGKVRRDVEFGSRVDVSVVRGVNGLEEVEREVGELCEAVFPLKVHPRVRRVVEEAVMGFWLSRGAAAHALRLLAHDYLFHSKHGWTAGVKNVQLEVASDDWIDLGFRGVGKEKRERIGLEEWRIMCAAHLTMSNAAWARSLLHKAPRAALIRALRDPDHYLPQLPDRTLRLLKEREDEADDDKVKEKGEDTCTKPKQYVDMSRAFLSLEDVGKRSCGVGHWWAKFVGDEGSGDGEDGSVKVGVKRRRGKRSRIGPQKEDEEEKGKGVKKQKRVVEGSVEDKARFTASLHDLAWIGVIKTSRAGVIRRIFDVLPEE